MKTETICKTWKSLEHPVFVVMEGALPYLEPTFEDKYETTVRVFLSNEEAVKYLLQVAEYEEAALCVEEMDLKRLFECRRGLYDRSKIEYDCTYRIEVSEIVDDELPTTLDILFDFGTTVH